MIKIQNLHKQFKFNKEHSINLEMGSNGFVVLLGDNGSGNKTLLNIIGGTESFDSGDVLVGNTSIKDVIENELASYRNTYIGYISDEVNLINELSVSKNIALVLELQGCNKEEISKLVDETLTRFNLQEFKDCKPNELSEIEKQKVKIARAIVKNPKILLVDGIVNKLEEDKTIIFEILKELSKEKLVIMATSEKDIIEQYSDRIIELKDGQIISDNILNENNLRLNNIDEDKTFKKSSFPLKSIFNITIKGLFKKKLTTLFFMLTLLFFGLATSFAQYDVGDVTGRNINENEIKEVYIYNPRGQSIYDNTLRSLVKVSESKIENDILSDMELFEEKYSNNKYYEVRLDEDAPGGYKEDSTYYELAQGDSVVIYDNVDQFKSSIIYGNEISNYNEVYITDYLADILYYGSMESLIGDEIEISYGSVVRMDSMLAKNYHKSFKFTIAGILDTDYEKYDYLKYPIEYKQVIKSSYPSDVKNKYDKIITTSENMELIDNILLEDSGIRLNNVSINNWQYRFMWSYPGVTNILDDDQFILIGTSRMPGDENEIVVPFDFIPLIVESEGLGTPTLEELMNKQDAYFNEYLNKQITLNYDIYDRRVEKELTIVGMYMNIDGFIDPGYNGNSIIVDDDLYKEIYLNNIHREIIVELGGNEQENLEFFQSLEDLDYKHITPFSDAIYNLELQSNITRNIFYGLGLITFTMFIFKSFNITQRKEEIHTIRALGARRIDIVKFFIIEGLIVGLLSIFIASVALSITAVSLHTESNLIKDIFNVLRYIIVWIFVIILSLYNLSYIISTRKDIDILRSSGTKRIDIFKLFGIERIIIWSLSIYLLYLAWSKTFVILYFNLKSKTQYLFSRNLQNNEDIFNMLVILSIVFTIILVRIINKFVQSKLEKVNQEIHTEQTLKVSEIDNVNFFNIEGLILGLTFIFITYIAFSITVVIINIYTTSKFDLAYFLPYQNLSSIFIIIGVGLVIFLISGLIDRARLKREELLNKITTKN